jgi:hypothetical protein
MLKKRRKQKRKQTGADYIGRRFQHASVSNQEYLISGLNDENLIVIKWLDPKLKERKTEYSQSDVLKYIIKKEWTLI